ncbi:23S rRNA (uracil(1939)-C(5))-methyltransferase RlmD [Anaerocolumna sedimenticola]|uniref:23S rRNA (Uracil(1939)-C(5))-methyltransferase RlmD n=1 Tax=Anaerocolumna sedimenticola TaxID=2696063 RepID=A0A6P1TK87_9FIRM|nr:23S rRNA (uracil(1939)-C(5))-methyltransferase RlmD [Anaerocolumna sedimenticola]QHQ60522.1 23S rRNA (uracil(1939)-C(5))-methyltransferase RlmD [Anaerocolumna sedimenticola]
MLINKNDELIIEIDDIGSEGEGIGKYQGYTLFVKNALPGDKVRVKAMKCKKNYGYARLMEVIEASPYRTTPQCGIADKCGGCSLMHLSYERQLLFKQNKVRNCLERIGGFKEELPLGPIIGMEEPYYYRNKAQFPVSRNKEGKVVMGFYAGGTHSIIDTDHCFIQAKENDKLIQIIRSFLENYNISIYEEEKHNGLVRHILTRIGYVTGEIMVCIVINGNELPHQDKLVQNLREIPGMTSISLNINKANTNVILGDKVINLWGKSYITDYIGDIKYQISPLSFYQVNPQQTKRLYEIALKFADLHGDETVWDLYCGIGTISLFLAGKAKQVYGVEIIPQAIEDAKRNAEINQIINAEFFVGAAEDILPEKYKENNIYADVIVVDPPRKGCEESLLDTIILMAPKKIVYVSCDPATLARDLRYLCDRGYELIKVQAVDQFAHSVHVETVALLNCKR